MTVRSVGIGEIAVLNPKQPQLLSDGDTTVPFLPMAAIREDGAAPTEQQRRLGDLTGSYTYFEKGDILLAKITPCFENGKVAHLNSLSHPFGFGSTEFHVLKAGPDVDPRYLYHAVRSPRFLRAGASSMTGSAGQQRVPAGFVARHRIPLPALSEQQRIAVILDRAAGIERKRRKTLAVLDEFLRSAFIEMFGDPVRNDKARQMARLGDLAAFVGGGTPRRAMPEFFTGSIPWATSKDMVSEDLLDTQEHITPEAVDQSATRVVPAGSILVVVKSKILLHRLPVAIARVPISFGQDIKAITPHDDRVSVSYLARHLRVGQQVLLNKARGANTEGLTLEHLRAYQVMLPPADLLEIWDRVEGTVRALRASFSDHLSSAKSLFYSLSQVAFGEGGN